MEQENSDAPTWDLNPFRDVVSTLMQSSANINEIQSLIYAHEHFSPSENLLHALVHFYNANKPLEVSAEVSSPDLVATRIINFLKNWIKVDKAKFRNPLRDLGKILSQFLSTLPEVWSALIKASLEEGGPIITVDQDEDDSDEKFAEISSNNLARKSSKSKKSSQPLQLLDFKAKDIAQQLTLIDQHYMKEIDLNELLGSKWTTPGEAPTLEKVAKRSDQFAYWILYEMIIVKLKYRTKLVAHVIDICNELVKLQNFQSLMNIYLAFNILSNDKLNLLADIMNNVALHQTFLVWQEISNLLDYAGNFKAYRDKLKSLSIPIILSQEVLLKDLLYNEEVSPNFEKDCPQLNATKLSVMGSIVVNFSKCRNSCFKIQHNPDLHRFLTNFPIVSREILEQLIDEKSDLYRVLVKYRKGKVLNLLDPSSSLNLNATDSLSVTSSQDTGTSTSMSTSMSMSNSEKTGQSPLKNSTGSVTKSDRPSSTSFKKLQIFGNK